MRFSTLAVAGLAFLAASAFGQTTHTWVATPVNGNWGTAANWNTNQVPVTGDSLVIAWGNNTNNDLVGVSFQSVMLVGALDGGITGNPIVLLSGGTLGADNSAFSVSQISVDVVLSGPATILTTRSSTSSSVLVLNNPISGTGDLTLVLDGSVIFNVPNTYVGTTTTTGVNYVHVNAGAGFPPASALTLNTFMSIYGPPDPSIGSLAGSGNFVSNTSVTVGSNNNSTTYSGRFYDDLGAAGLVKVGTGTMTVSGMSNAYSGQTQVVAGRLNVTGSIVSPTVVESGATLGGTGTINNTVQVNSGGTLAPGVLAGTLTTGNLSFDAGSTLAVELNGTAAGQFDRVVSTGAVNIGGGTIAVNPGFVPAGGAVFPIVQGVSITGTFASITAPAGLQLAAQYGPTSVTLVVTAPPDAPTIGTVVPGNAQATVSFTPGATNFSPITSFTATCGAFTATGPTSPITVAGLTNGTPYTCTVFATNAVGNGPASAASASVTPFTIPAAPAITSVTPGNIQITVAFTTPANNGSAILDYTANCGGTTATAATSPIAVTGLVNGTPYTCTVLARNAAGNGPASAASASVTPFTNPAAPSITSVTPGNAQVTVAFTPPTANGSPILDYAANCGGSIVVGPGSPITIGGLANGTPYTCTVLARNAAGNGPASAPSVSVTPFTNPGTPVITSVTPSVGMLTVAFSAAVSNGSPVTGYTANCGGVIATGAASPLTVTGLVNGTPYTCTVFATNGAGNGPPSPPSAPVAPLINSFTAPSPTGSGTITASFTGGGAGCSYSVNQFIPVSGHAASPPTGSAPGATTFPHGLFDFRLIGCTAGSSITMTVTYPSPLPAGTVYWKYGPTPSNTAPHWYTLPSTVAGNVVTFTITDGQQGDDDLAANGTIVDQGGPGVPGSPGTATAVPTLSEWMLMVLALAMFGSMAMRRRR